MYIFNSACIVADVHLSQYNSERSKRFFNTLSKVSSSVEVIIILGDLFDTWIGDDIECRIYANEISKLRSLQKPIYLLLGNRDFLIGSAFFKHSGVKKIPDRFYFNIAGKNFFACHGDIFCTKDYKYQFYKRLLHNQFFKKLFTIAPEKYRIWVEKTLQKKSTQRYKILKNKINFSDTQPQLNAIVKELRLYPKTDYLVYGHTHNSLRDKIDIIKNNKKKTLTRFVLGDWYQDIGAYLIVKKERLYFGNDFKDF